MLFLVEVTLVDNCLELIMLFRYHNVHIFYCKTISEDKYKIIRAMMT